jgi:hypothetical protein
MKFNYTMRIKYNTITGTYWVIKPGRSTQLRKDTTPKMREIMKSEPRIEGCFKIWEGTYGNNQR